MPKPSHWREAWEQASWASGEPRPSQEPPFHPHPASVPQARLCPEALPPFQKPCLHPSPRLARRPQLHTKRDRRSAGSREGDGRGVWDPAFLPFPCPHGP